MQIRCWGKYFILALLVISNINFVFAQDITSNTDQYVVNDIIANASGKTPSQARANAIISGQKNAFIILLERLGVNNNVANSFDDKTIADMVLSQQILNEKITRNSYSATLNLKFSESFVKHYLENNLTPTKKQNTIAKPNINLILPIKLTKNQPLIWEENNSWRAAINNTINNISKNSASSFLKIPKGDVDDIAIIGPYNINNINFTDVEPILNKYKANSLMLVYFDFDSLENKVNITLQVIKQFAVTNTKLEFINVSQLTQEDLVNKVATKTVGYIIGISDQQPPQLP